LSQTRPNILFILIDDMGWTDLSCCGSEYYETPNIDSLCAEGMRFTDGYAACPVCSPTRASLLTGKYPATVGITDWIHWGDARPAPRGRVIDVRYLRDLPTSETSIASALRDGGYATWHVGKWHLGGKGHLPQDHGFDVNVGGCHMGSPGQGGYFSPWTIEPLVEADVPAETYLTDYLTDRAVDLIDHVGETPFFLNLSYYSVHTPIQAKAERIARYEDKARRLGLDRFDTFVEGEFFPCEHKKGHRVRRRLLHSDPVYAAMIDSLDEGIGRVLAALERNGKARDTIVVFTSDNGGLATSEGSPTCNAPLAEGKGWMYEGGTREPLFVRWPEQIAAGSSCATPVTSPDFYPTLLEAAGLPLRPEQHVDGVSILPLLRGGDTLEREGIFWHYPHYGNQGGTPGSSVRCDDWKLIEFFEDGRRELYHLRDDISEERNLAADHPDIERDLYERLAVWRESVEAKIPEPNPAWNP
jgi:arylsulfatase A-like enzyme